VTYYRLASLDEAFMALTGHSADKGRAGKGRAGPGGTARDRRRLVQGGLGELRDDHEGGHRDGCQHEQGGQRRQEQARTADSDHLAAYRTLPSGHRKRNQWKS